MNRMRNAAAMALGLWLTASVGPAWAGAPGLCYDPGSRAGYVCTPCNCSGDRTVSDASGTCKVCQMPLVARKDLQHVAILLYDGVELLDWSGVGEVFAATRGGFYVYTVSKDGKPVTSQGFVRVDPEYSLRECPWPDILVVPGGGTGGVVADRETMEWVEIVGKQANTVMSVCSGAFVLAKAGFLDGLQATTHSADVNELRRAAPRTTVHADARFVDNGKVITTAGVSAGIDGALHVVSRLLGTERARQTAEYMQYDRWVPDAGLVVARQSGSRGQN